MTHELRAEGRLKPRRRSRFDGTIRYGGEAGQVKAGTRERRVGADRNGAGGLACAPLVCQAAVELAKSELAAARSLSDRGFTSDTSRGNVRPIFRRRKRSRQPWRPS